MVGADLDGSTVEFVGQSLGSIIGTAYMAIEPRVHVGVLNVPGGGVARLLDASPAFGPSIHAGLAQAGLTQGTPQYDAFFVAAQTVVDSGDSINYAVVHRRQGDPRAGSGRRCERIRRIR